MKSEWLQWAVSSWQLEIIIYIESRLIARSGFRLMHMISNHLFPDHLKSYNLASNMD
jgi:hypothetical protein